MRWAWLDKISISYDLGVARTVDVAAVHERFKAIARESNLLANDGSENKPRMVIRRRGKNWLFKGMLTTETRRSHGNTLLRLQVDLNPLRFFANNPPGRRRERFKPFYKVQSHTPSMTHAQHETTNSEDNYVVDARLPEAAVANWNAQLDEYISLIHGLIISELSKDVQAGFFIFNQPLHNWTIGSAEICWEFAVNDAPFFVKNFGRYTKGLFPKTSTKFHLNKVEQEYIGNSYIYETRYNKVKAAMYAKSDNRVRLECRFIKYPRQIFADLNTNTFPPLSANAFYEMTDALKIKAISMLSPLIMARQKYKAKSLQRRMLVVDALSGLAYHSQQQGQDVSHIIKLLCAGTSVSERIGHPQHNQLLRDLKERDLLQTPYRKKSNRPVQYVPGPILRKIMRMFFPEE